MLFTGTGCSSGLPLIGCAVGRPDTSPQRDCQACVHALRNGTSDPNWRNNVGVLLRFQKGGRTTHVQVDCGKTFRDSCTRIYAAHGVWTIDALLLTHDQCVAQLSNCVLLLCFSRPVVLPMVTPASGASWRQR